MSELTNEKLEEYARDGRNAGDVEVEQMARELLALRTRDAGDDEGIDREVLDEYDWIAQFGIYSTMSEERIEGVKRLAKLRDIAITRGQTRTDAVNKAAEWARECEGLREQIATLTAERDEALGKIHSAKIFIDALSKWLECGATIENSGDWYSYLQTVANNWNLRMQEACDLRDRLKSEIAALKSAPGMSEVDAILQDAEKSSEQIESELADLARRSIASREEVVGLLKEAAGYSDGRLESRAENGDPVAIRIIEIVEGK